MYLSYTKPFPKIEFLSLSSETQRTLFVKAEFSWLKVCGQQQMTWQHELKELTKALVRIDSIFFPEVFKIAVAYGLPLIDMKKSESVAVLLSTSSRYA